MLNFQLRMQLRKHLQESNPLWMRELQNYPSDRFSDDFTEIWYLMQIYILLSSNSKFELAKPVFLTFQLLFTNTSRLRRLNRVQGTSVGLIFYFSLFPLKLRPQAISSFRPFEVL